MKKIVMLLKKYEEIIMYLFIGGLTTIVSLLTYFVVMKFLNPDNAIHIQIANIISWILSVSFAYITNRVFVFKSKNQHIFKEVINFTGSRLLTLILDMLIMFIFVSILHLNDKIIKIISQIFVIIANYVLSKLVVFKKTSQSQ